MDDRKIVEMLYQRAESALGAAEKKYGEMCRALARNLLGDEQDALECVNDTWHALWDSIPPHKPERLGPFLAKLLRNHAMKRLRYTNADKRSAVVVSYEELSGCIPAAWTVEQWLEGRELSQTLNRFLDTLSRDNRDLFLRRYWFGDSVEEIAKGFCMSQGRVRTRLYRIRNQLKEYLEKELEIYVGK